jgi:hypothetical protein
MNINKRRPHHSFLGGTMNTWWRTYFTQQIIAQTLPYLLALVIHTSDWSFIIIHCLKLTNSRWIQKSNTVVVNKKLIKKHRNPIQPLCVEAYCWIIITYFTLLTALTTQNFLHINEFKQVQKFWGTKLRVLKVTKINILVTAHSGPTLWSEGNKHDSLLSWY